MSAFTISAFAEGQNKVAPAKPAPVFAPRLPVAPVTRPVITAPRPITLNPVRRLPQTLTPRTAFERLYTGGADTHPVQFHRGDGKSLPPIYATGAGPGKYTNPLTVLQPKTGRK